MADLNRRITPDPLTQVFEAFNRWRGYQGRRGRIPNDLSEQATALADHYLLVIIAAALRGMGTILRISARIVVYESEHLHITPRIKRHSIFEAVFLCRRLPC